MLLTSQLAGREFWFHCSFVNLQHSEDLEGIALQMNIKIILVKVFVKHRQRLPGMRSCTACNVVAIRVAEKIDPRSCLQPRDDCGNGNTHELVRGHPTTYLFYLFSFMGVNTDCLDLFSVWDLAYNDNRLGTPQPSGQQQFSPMKSKRSRSHAVTWRSVPNC